MPLSAKATVATQRNNPDKQGTIVVDPPTFALFPLEASHYYGLASLTQEERVILKQLFEAYDHVFLLDRFTGVNTEQRRQRKMVSAVSQQSTHDDQQHATQVSQLRALAERYRVKQAVDDLRTRAINYYHVSRCLQKDTFWQLMIPYADRVTLQRLQQQYQSILTFAHVPTSALLYLSAEMLPLIRQRVQGYLQELTDKSSYHKVYFMAQYERYLIKTLQHVEKQQQLILRSLSARAALAISLSTDHRLGHGDVLHQACQAVLAALQQTPTDNDVKAVLRSLQVIVRKPPRQDVTLATQVALYQFLKKPAVMALPKTAYYQQTLWQALTQYFQRDGRTVLLSRGQERLLVPKRLQSYIPPSPGWPPWLWKGRRLRYRFVEQQISSLVECEQQIAELQQHVQRAQQRGQSLSARKVKQIGQQVDKALDGAKQAAQAQRFGGMSRHWRQRANQFLSAWVFECDAVRDTLLTTQIAFLAIQIAHCHQQVHHGLTHIEIQETQALLHELNERLEQMSPADPALQQRLTTVKTQYQRIGDYGVYFMRQLLQWPAQKLRVSLQQQQTATIRINGDTTIPVTTETIKGVIEWIMILGRSGHRQTLKRDVEAYLSCYDGSDNVLQTLMIPFNDPTLIKTYHQKRLQWLFAHKHYQAILCEPSFQDHQTHIKALLQPQLAQVIQHDHRADIALLPLVKRYASTVAQHQYYRQLLKRALTDPTFFKKHQSQLEPYLRCNTFAEVQARFGVANLREVGQWLATFIQHYPEQQPAPDLLAMIKPYFTSVFVATYGLGATKSALDILCQQDKQARQAHQRAKPLTALFDRAVTLTEPLRQHAFKTLLEKLQFTIERQQYSQVNPTQQAVPPECAVLIKHMTQRLIALALSDHRQRYRLFKHLHQHVIKKLPNVIDTNALMTVIINMRRIRPTIAKLMVGLDDIIQQRQGITLDINRFVLTLLKHLPAKTAKQFIHQLQAALIKTAQNDPLHYVLTALLKVIEDRQLNTHERQLCDHFSMFKTVINTQLCQQVTRGRDRFALEEGEVEALMTTAYGDPRYHVFWQRVGKVTSPAQPYAMDLERALLQERYQHQQPMSPITMRSFVNATLLQCLAEPHSQTARTMVQQTQAALALFARHLRQQAGLRTISPSPTSAHHPALINGCALLHAQQETHRMITLVYQVCDEKIKTVRQALQQAPAQPKGSRWCYFTRTQQAGSAKSIEAIRQCQSLLKPLQMLAEAEQKHNDSASFIKDVSQTLDTIIERLPTLKFANTLQASLLNVLQSSRVLISPSGTKTLSPQVTMLRR